ncbi:MAG: hypothetical protein AB9915_02555 [Candidatus Dojkabacteria bacterium]
MLKKLLQYGIFSLLFLIPSTVLAADLEITCYSDQSPLIVKNTDPLFQLSGFLPGSSASRTVYVKNTDTENNCKIYFDLSGSTNSLTNKINVQVSSGLFNDTLSHYITGERILMANLSPKGEITRTITMNFPSDANNTFTLKQASFDIAIQSEWGSEEDQNGEVEGVTDTDEKKTILDKISSLLGIGDGENEIDPNGTGGGNPESVNQNEVVLGEEDTNTTCTEKTLWWLPLIVQLILTVAIVSVDKSILRKTYIKLVMSLVLGVIAYFVVNKIGCGCNPVWLCTNHWVLNAFIAILPLLRDIKRKPSTLISSQQTLS